MKLHGDILLGLVKYSTVQSSIISANSFKLRIKLQSCREVYLGWRSQQAFLVLGCTVLETLRCEHLAGLRWCGNKKIEFQFSPEKFFNEK
jgi:hypothetical protein